MVHDATRGCHNDVTELTGRQQIIGPFFNVFDSDIKSGRNHTNFVQSSGQIDHNFAATMIVDYFEFANISMFHHNLQKSDYNFGGRSQKDLSLASFSALFMHLSAVANESINTMMKLY